MNVWEVPRPSALGQSLQWDANLRRLLEGLPPFPGPRPHPAELEIWRKELAWHTKA